MTLHPQEEFSIPEETVRVAHAAYPKGNVYIKMRDALGTIYQDQTFAHLFPHNGRSVEAPWRLALITVMQFLEELPDRQAADAVRGRIDWKYALGLDLANPGFDATVLCEFRKRLVEGEAEHLLFDVMVTLFKERGLLKQGERQRTDSTHVLARVRAVNRLMCVGEAMRFALNSLAVVADDWLLEHSDPEWLDRYGHRIEEAHLPHHQTERQERAEIIGRDGSTLLTDIFAPSAPPLLRMIPAVEILRRIWVQNYFWTDGQIHWRSNDDIAPATTFINSPYDQEARYGKKRETRWTGYKIHLTETCEANLPHLITHVVTTTAPITDEAMTETIHQDLEHNDLSPSQHLVDSGYVTAPILVSSRASGIDMIGPRRPDVRWQANTENGIDVSQFHIDWENECAICPQGHTSSSWTPTLDSRGNESIKIRFSSTDCRPCPLLASCTSSQTSTPRRLISVRPREQHEARHSARRREQTPAFTKLYAQREGIEATISQGVRAFGMRRSRYIGINKTHLQHLSIAAAINVVRVVAWLDGDLPAPTRVTPFQQLYPAA